MRENCNGEERSEILVAGASLSLLSSSSLLFFFVVLVVVLVAFGVDGGERELPQTVKSKVGYSAQVCRRCRCRRICCWWWWLYLL